MAVLIVIFDGAIPQSLAKDRLLHAVGVGRTGNTTIRGRLGVLSNEHIAGRARGDAVDSVRCAVPYGVCRVGGGERTCLAGSTRRACLASVFVGIHNVLLFIASYAGPQPAACFLSGPPCGARLAGHGHGLL